MPSSMISELPNTVQKFILTMASGKFASVKPFLAPIRLSGSRIISDFSLNTLITTRINGKIKQKKTTIRMMNMIVWIILFLRRAFSLS